jgi:hypothetical protein
VLVALAAGLTWLLFAPRTPDLAAQVYRAGLFGQEGFSIWDGQWYGGHHMPGYSLLFPPLASWLGVRIVGLAAAVASGIVFERLTVAHFGPRARWGALWLGAATACDLFIGRLTFGLGVAVGLAALLALQRRHTALAAGLSLACAAASPVSGLFLALAGAALWLGAGQRRSALALAAPALTLILALALAFPEGGRQPFTAMEASFVLASAAAVALLLPREERVLRIGALLYAAGTIAAYLLPTPMGSNAGRLGATFAGPLVVCALGRRAFRPAILAVLVPILVWQWWAPVREVAKGVDDPATTSAYYAPVVAELQRRADGPIRIEVPFTRSHWEAVFLARHFALARGWETQLDTKYHELFYEQTGRISPARYQAWLNRNGVAYVALPDAALDASARAEAALIATRPSYLEPVWHDEHWQLFRVRDAVGLVEGPARMTALHPDGFALQATGPGTVLVRVRHTPYWAVTAGAACVSKAAGGWTAVTVPHAGPVRVQARLELPRATRCAS